LAAWSRDARSTTEPGPCAASPTCWRRAAEDIARCSITRETGKPLWESREEVTSAVRVARLLATEGPKLAAGQDAARGCGVERSCCPHGTVVGIITPYVFPLVIPVLHILAALVTGNTRGVQAVASSRRRSVRPSLSVSTAAGCRAVSFNMVQGSGAAVGHRVATHPGIDALLFAGSHEHGHRRSGAPRL
jgi:acyl-CoA reductase-like NAD-dependent aldehyde dehydrogenase